MRVRNESEYPYDPGNLAPWLFCGPIAPNTERQFCDAPLMSEYWDVVGKVKYIKYLNNKAAADWNPVVIAGATITGNLTVTGTVTAGDIVATAG